MPEQELGEDKQKSSEPISVQETQLIYPMPIEVRGGGHIVLPDGRGVPGLFANCRVWVDEAAQPIRVEPLVPTESPPDVQAENSAENEVIQP